MPHSAQPPPRPVPDELVAPATQIVRDRDAYLGASRDVGRRLGEDQYELFVTDDPAVALQRELQRLAPSFIALHDVGTHASLRLLQAVAAGSGRLMRLTIRRQGQGVALATLHFVEIAGGDGAALRIYSTDVDADSHGRLQMARVLVSHARLAVLLFGELPGHALASAVQPLLDAARHAPWPNRQMLMVPLGAPAPLGAFANRFSAGGLRVQVTPRVAQPVDAWPYIGSTWNQLEGAAPRPSAAAATATAAAVDDEAPTEPMGLGRARDGVDWYEFVQRCAAIKGMVSCCVFDRRDGKPLAHAGARPSAELMQVLGEQLLAAAADAGARLGTGHQVLEATFSFAGHHVLLRTLPRQPGVVLHALLDAATGNLTLARAQLQRLDTG